MNDFCTDIGYHSLNKYGEELCGDQVEVVEKEDGSVIVVLADGLGSGVKANILATLTTKILGTMIAQGVAIEECIQTMADTLPVCATCGVAYATFTIIYLRPGRAEAEVIQYDNPPVILLRNGKHCEFPRTVLQLQGKSISHSLVKLCENDTFIMMSDGCVHAGIGQELNFGWQRQDIISFLEPRWQAGITAKTYNAMLLEQCNRLYAGKPGDDTTSCTLRVRKREPLNLLIGPPSQKEDGQKMMALFFAKAGKHIVCGGTTATIAAAYLGKSVRPVLAFSDPEVPPIAQIEGVDLVTEGVITIQKVLSYAQDYLGANQSYPYWSTQQDGASLIARLLFEEATDINFYVGKAVNPAQQNPELPICFSIKMQLVHDLAACLKKMGKRIKVSYF